MDKYFNESANMADLVTQVDDFDAALFQSFGHNQFEAAFKDRIFVLYKPRGAGQEPEVITQVKVLDLVAEAEYGCEILIQDVATGNELWIGHVPTRLWGYKVFMQVPPYLQLKWDAHVDRMGVTRRSLSFGVLVKTANRSDFNSDGNTYCLPPNKFRGYFPSVNLQLS